MLLALSGPVAGQCEFARFERVGAVNFNAFGLSVGVDGSRAIIGGDFPRAVIGTIDGSNWYESQVVTGSDTVFGDLFGFDVDIEGTTVVVGAPAQASLGPNAGAAYVFEFVGTSWVESAKLLASDGAPADLFGRSVAVSGIRIVVGAPAGDSSVADSGAVYVFEKSGAVWNETAKLTASDATKFWGFGEGMDLGVDRIAIGSRSATGQGPSTGAVYVFDFDGVSWTETAKLARAGGAPQDDFGVRLALAIDRLAVGAPRAGGTGGAFVFDRIGGQWSETAQLFPSDGAVADNFGTGIAIEGDEILVGAPNLSLIGKAYLYSLQASTWVETKLQAAGLAPFDAYGYSCAIQGDNLLVGANRPFAPITRKGFMTAFSKSGTRCYDLVATPSTLSVSTGGAQFLSITAGASYGGMLYLVGGSASGSSPGTTFGASRFPLNIDAYLLFTLANANLGPMLSQTLGSLDASGNANATISVPSGSDPALAGIELTHAFAVIDAVGSILIPHVGTKATLTLTP